MSDIVERVAAALETADTKEIESREDWYKILARAAIQAMKEPTEEMIEAADGGGDGDWANRFIYRAMIFTALGESYNWRTDN